MLNKLALVALGVGVYLAFLIVSFPASVAKRWFVPDEVSLAVLNGSVWNGSAAYGAVEGIAFTDLNWQLSPVSLLSGKVDLVADLRLPTGFASTNVLATSDRIEFTDLRASTNLALFREPFALGEIEGDVSLSLDRLEISNGRPVTAIGEMQVANLAAPPPLPINGVSVISLGNFRASLTSGDQPGLVALLNDEGGPLELSGQLTLSPEGSYVLDSMIRPRADASQHLVDGLQLMAGPPNAEGQRNFVLRGTL